MLNLANEVYNHNLKEAWIDDYMRVSGVAEDFVIKNIVPIFKKAKITEDTLQRDLCCFTLKQIEALLRSFGSGSIPSLRNRASYFRSYTDYAILKRFSLDGQNHYNDLSLENYNACISKRRAESTVFDYDDIREMLDSEELGTNARDQYLILAPWEGICGKNFCEIINLSVKDLDPSSNTVHLCTGRDVKVSPELMSIMEDAGSSQVYISSEGKERNLLDCDLIFKPLKSASAVTNVNAAVLTRRMGNLRKYIGSNNLGFNVLRVSGFCYYLYELVNEKGKSISELHNEKDEDYLYLIEKYAFTKKSSTEIKYMYDAYVKAKHLDDTEETEEK